jgi:DNA-binding LytR/AlgR family response regulator
MWRSFLIAALMALAATAAQAQAGPWQVCRGGPALTDCRPAPRFIDPQGREIWLRAPVAPRKDAGPKAVFVYGAASTEAWFNGVRLGANGQPGPTAEAERPGRYQAAFPIPDALWRPTGNEVVLRMSAFHVGMRFLAPIGGLGVGRYPQPSRLGVLAVTFVAAGALAAAAFGFGAIHARRRTGSSLLLAALAGVVVLQVLAESLRHLWNYPYPVHAWRMMAIWLLSVAFALLLVAWTGARFLPRRRAWLAGLAVVAVPASYLAAGFDVKSSLALLIGAAIAALPVLVGVRQGASGARATLAWLVLFVAAGLAEPFWLLDISYFVLAAVLTLPLLVVEVLRLGRDDRDREAALTRAASRPDRLTVASARGVELVPLRDIVAILGADDYAELRLAGGRTLLHAARLDSLEAALPAGFLRIHRSAIANLDHAERLVRDGQRWRLEMVDGPALTVSRSRLAALRDRLEAQALAA